MCVGHKAFSKSVIQQADYYTDTLANISEITAMKVKVGNYLFKPRLIPTLMSSAFFVLFLMLGHWQWQRAIYKESLRDRYLQGATAAPLTIETVVRLGKDANAFPVSIDGSFDNSHNILLDNQVENMMVGFQVLTPFITTQHEILLVDRGWLPMGKDRAHFTAIPMLDTREFHIVGKVYCPSEKQFVLQADNFTDVHWPLLVQKLDLDGIGKALGVELAPFVLRLDEDQRVESEQQLVRHWQFMVMGPEKSWGYSFQWYGMAIVLFLFYGYFSVEKVKVND